MSARLSSAVLTALACTTRSAESLATTYAVHKPRGVLSEAGAINGQRTLTDVMRAAGVRPLTGHVGRLDVQTSGLILITDDSSLLRAILAEESALAKRYTLLVVGRHDPGSAPLASLAAPLSFQRSGKRYLADAARVAHVRCYQDPLLLSSGETDRIDREEGDDGAAARRRGGWRRAGPSPRSAIANDAEEEEGSAAVDDDDSTAGADGWLTEIAVEICQGRNHQIRRLCWRAGLQLLHLRRVSIGPVELGGMRAGDVRALSQQETEVLQAACLPRYLEGVERKRKAAEVEQQRARRRELRARWRGGASSGA